MALVDARSNTSVRTRSARVGGYAVSAGGHSARDLRPRIVYLRLFVFDSRLDHVIGIQLVSDRRRSRILQYAAIRQMGGYMYKILAFAVLSISLFSCAVPDSETSAPPEERINVEQLVMPNVTCGLTCGASCPTGCYATSSSSHNGACVAQGNLAESCTAVPASGSINACGASCPAGWYISSSRSNGACQVEFNTQETCNSLPASGSINACGACPSGWYPTSSRANGVCTLQANVQETCQLIPASGTIMVCGTICPSGFSSVSTGSNGICPNEGNIVTTCRR